MTIILKGASVVGDYKMPYPVEQDQGLTDQVIQATKEAQRDALAQHSADIAQLDATGIEDDAIAQLEAADRFEYTVDELVDLVVRLRANCECYRDLIKSDRLPKNVRALLVERGYTCLMELKRLQAGRVVV